MIEALRELVLFAQFLKHEKHQWTSVTFSKIAGLFVPQKNNTSP